MNNILFSVIVPFYNKEKTIDFCMRSVLNQDYPKDRYEVICVDNNSTDSSCAVVAKYPSVKLIHEKRQGAYIARNAGILESKGSFVIFTDADAEVKKDWLNNITLAVQRNNYDVLIGWYRPICNSLILQIHSLLVSERIKNAIKKRKSCMLTASASNLTVKKEVFEKEGLFKELRRSEDKYFVLRCFEKGYKVGFEEKVEIVRKDFRSLKDALMKNFIYGFANALYIRRRFSLKERLELLESKLLIMRFVFRYFPLGTALLLFTFFYSIGHHLGSVVRDVIRSFSIRYVDML